MPRPSKGARLYERKRQGRAPVWEIRDGETRQTIGAVSRREAETALAEYIHGRDRPGGPLPAEEMTVGQALEIYAEDHAPTTAAPERIGYAVTALWAFWHHLPVSAVKGATCRRYVAERGKAAGTVRRELGALQAALNFCAREGHLLTAPLVWRPDPDAPKDRWLTRDEAARLLRATRKLRVDGQHLGKFILTGLYTGSRKASILSLRIDQPSTHGGWIDTAQGVLYRRGTGDRQTKKRQTPARLPRQYLAHVRRWSNSGARFVVQDYRGHRVGDIRKGWARACEMAGLDGITPHVLRHSAATWMMQRGADPWHVAGYLGMSHDTLMSVYGHHSPEWQSSAVRAMEDRA